MRSALWKRVEAAALALALCVLCLAPASAASSSTYETVKGQNCALTIMFAPGGEAMTNNVFRIWRVGTLSDRGCLPFAEFGAYHVLNGTGSWPDKAGTLLSYLQRDNVAPTQTAATGEDGRVTFNIPAAEQGLYLVAGDSQWRDGTRYTPTPVLIMVPYTRDLQNWETDVESRDKFDVYTPSDPDRPEPLQRHVLKSWEDDGYEDERPESITVDLLRDGQVDRSETLTAANNWRCDWTDLDPQYEWTVAERENDQYSVLVEQEGITFHITNTWQEEIDPENPPLIDIPDNPDNPDDPDVPDTPDDPGTEDIPDEEVPQDGGLPQTGQLWWPVAPLAIGGVMFLLIGWKRRRDWSGSDEA